MIYRIDIKPDNGTSRTFNLREDDPNAQAFYFESVEGLGPVGADIDMSKLGSGDGSRFNSATFAERVITFTLGFIPYSEIEENRSTVLYDMFPPGERVRLRFYKDNEIEDGTQVYHEIYGYVESNEPDIWSNDCKASIVVRCPYPWFMKSTILSLDVRFAPHSGATHYVLEVPAGYLQTDTGIALEVRGYAQHSGSYYQLEVHKSNYEEMADDMSHTPLQSFVMGAWNKDNPRAIKGNTDVVYNSDPPGRFVKKSNAPGATRWWAMSWVSSKSHDWITFGRSDVNQYLHIYLNWLNGSSFAPSPTINLWTAIIVKEIGI